MKKDAKTPDVDRILKTLRSLGTGGLLGSAAGIGAYVLLPSVRAAGLSLQVAAGVGAAVCTAGHPSLTPGLPLLKHYQQQAANQGEGGGLLLFEEPPAAPSTRNPRPRF